jgi:hypothetical protein
MTLMSSISKLTTSVDQLAGEANVTKAQLDAKVAQADAEVFAAQAEQTTTEAVRDESAAHAASAATHLATVKANVTYEGIGVILAEKAVTAVDVFVYDTSLDSDGGAWRKRCQHTSWYNEPLNTAARGARREFPAVAVIVLEGGRLVIYDGDNPSLPMWMRFDDDYTSMVPHNGNQKAVSAINGIVSNIGVQWAGISFAADNCKRISGPFSASGYYKGRISERNARNGYNETIAVRLSNGNCYGVAMTVLPDAPIDPATGLPVPTIAVATAGGVSVIRQDGAVVDSAKTTAATDRCLSNKLSADFMRRL